MFTLQLGLVTAAVLHGDADHHDMNIIRELRERRSPTPLSPKSPLANQQPGMRVPAPYPPVEQPPPADPPPPPPPPPQLPIPNNNNFA
ncbi:hypothetical protein ACFX13_040138 [Malus domestica]